MVSSVATLPNGDVVAGGYFTTIGGTPANYIARWDGNSWSPLGAGMSHAVLRVAAMPNGDIIASGFFTSAGGNPASRIARWDGNTWSEFGGGFTGLSGTIVGLANGDVLVAGYAAVGGPSHNLGRWDGASWSALGGDVNGPVSSLVILPNGDVIAGGSFSMAGGNPAVQVARWNGTAWSALGTGVNFHVDAIAALPNGDVIAGGRHTTPVVAGNHISRWDGNTWTPIGQGDRKIITALVTLPNGEVAASCASVTNISGVATFFGRYASTCPASVATITNGCPGSGGANTLTANNLPWTGATFRAEGSGLPAFALVGVVSGFNTITTPLSSLLAQGLPGCNLNVSPDFVQFVLTTTGTATSSLTLPNTPALAGTVFHQQMVPFELDAALNFITITATNSLSITIGSF